MNYKILIIITLLFTFFITSYSQNIQPNDYINLNVDQGLSNARIHSFFKDKDGFLWIGTKDGLNRFDGSKFKLYQNNPEDPNSIANGYILDIQQDKNGYLWLAIDGGGINILNPITDKITKLFKGQQFIQNRLQYVKQIIIDDTIVWIATWGGLVRYNTINQTYQVFQNTSSANSIKSTDVKTIASNNSNFLWVGTTQGLSKINKETLQIDNSIQTMGGKPIPNKCIRSLFIDKKNTLWIGITGNLLEYNLNNGKLEQYELNNFDIESNVINKVYEDDNQNIWVCTNNGIYKKIKDGSLFNTTLLQSKTINCVYKDKRNKLWVGTNNEGIYVFSADKKPIQTVLPKTSENCSRIEAIIKDDTNTIWYATYGCGIYKYNPTTDQHQAYFQNTNLKNNKIASLYIDKKNNLWIGTQLDGLHCYNFKNQELTHVIKNTSILSLYEHDDHTLWLATDYGLRILDLKSNTEITKEYIKKLPKELLDAYILFIKKDAKNNIWVSSVLHGIYVFNKELKTTERYDFKNNSNNYISFYENKIDNSIYLGTDYGGILKINEDKSTKIITTEDGLISNTITAITADNDNNIWVSSTKGIGLIKNKHPKTYLSFNKRDGVDSYEFYDNAVVKDSLGNIYFGGLNGISYIDPKKIIITKNHQKTIINDLHIFNNKYISDTIISHKKKITLNYKQNFIKFSFTNLEFTPYDKYSYKYKLEGVDNRWNTSNSNKSASYTNLQPGKYTFRVTSVNSYGLWNTTPDTLTIEITPPYWRTWWFYCLYIIILCTIVAIIIRFREKKIISDKELAQFKLQALRSQMNPHFIFNALNSIQHFIIKKESRFALDYLSKFSKLVRKILENSVNDKIALSDEIAFLKSYIEIESLRFDKNINFEINLNNCDSCEYLEIPSMLIQPYVENAIIHGLMHLDNDENPTIKIEFYKKENSIKCTITDNGIGRKASQATNNKIKAKHKSLGLSITKSRLDTFNKLNYSSITVTIEDLIDTEKKAVGTKVEITIPID